MTMIFENRQARDNYIPHPEHKKVVDMILPLLKNGTDSLVVVDWFLKDNNQV